jgi:hypothetical protein
MDKVARQLLGFALGAWHTTLFVVVGVLSLNLTGAVRTVLSELNTLAGIGLFLLLWACTHWRTSRLVNEMLDSDGVLWGHGWFLLRASSAGAAIGALFWMGLVIGGAILFQEPSMGFALSVTPIAFLVGAIISIPVALLDLWCLRFMRRAG